MVLDGVLFWVSAFIQVWISPIVDSISICTGCLISIWTILWGCFEVTGWLKIIFFNSSEKLMQIPLKVNKIHFLWHQGWPHNDLLLLKTKVQLLHHTYLWPPILWHSKAMHKGKIEAMATKFSIMFAISMLKKHRKFCRRGLTHLDATPIFNKSFRYLWDTLY